MTKLRRWKLPVLSCGDVEVPTYSVSDISSMQNYFFCKFYDTIDLSRLLQEDCCIYDFVLSLG